MLRCIQEPFWGHGKEKRWSFEIFKLHESLEQKPGWRFTARSISEIEVASDDKAPEEEEEAEAGV